MILFVLVLAGASGLATGFALGQSYGGRDVGPYKRRARKAEKALQTIANGAGNPTLEAQIALDELSKELK